MLLDWWESRKLAKVADRQRRWALRQIQKYAEQLYDSHPHNEIHQIGYALIRMSIEIPPPDFK